jgi:hypothetical protein
MEGNVYGPRFHMPDFSLRNRPVGEYLRPLLWGEDFEKWKLVSVNTPMDGNCLFHAILNATSYLYREGYIEGKEVKRSTMVSVLRKEMAEKLSTIPNGKKESYYDSLSNGNIKAFSENVPEFTLEYMTAELMSNKPIGYGYIEYICDIFDSDIYILERNRKDLYITHEMLYCIKGNRNSIVLLYMEGHYELVGILKETEITTYFTSDHSLIQFLNEKTRAIVEKFKEKLVDEKDQEKIPEDPAMIPEIIE